MKRRLDGHPCLNSSSGGVFNSNSVPSSAANSADSNSRTFPGGALNSNIPLTTSVTSSSTATPAFRSRRTLFAPISPDNSNRPSIPTIPRRPFAAIQGTVEAVGTQGEAHDATQMQGDGSLEDEIRREYVEAVSYVWRVKNKLGMQSQDYRDFLATLKEYDAFRIPLHEVYRRFSNIFRGHPELIVGFDAFMPPEDGICDWIRRNEQVQVSTPGTNLASGGSTAPTSSTILPGGPPVSSPPPSSHTQPNHSTHATSPFFSWEMM